MTESQKDGLPSFCFWTFLTHTDGMKFRTLFSIVTLGLLSVAVAAQDRIYRCGNEYTNTVSEAQAKQCKLVSGGNVTVVQAVKPVPKAASATTTATARADAADQRAKDSDARLVLEAELKRAEARQEELLREYNKGAPDRLPLEMRDQQRYMNRIADLKASISRNESDIAGIRRELARVLTAAATPAPK